MQGPTNTPMTILRRSVKHRNKFHQTIGAHLTVKVHKQIAVAICLATVKSACFLQNTRKSEISVGACKYFMCF